MTGLFLLITLHQIIEECVKKSVRLQLSEWPSQRQFLLSLSYRHGISFLHPPGLEYPGISILHCTIQLRLVSAFISEEVSPNTLLILGTKPWIKLDWALRKCGKSWKKPLHRMGFLYCAALGSKWALISTLTVFPVLSTFLFESSALQPQKGSVV